MKELTCIVCPRGCHLLIDDNNKVSGNSCPRGEKYAIQEITDPRRTLTSTVRVDSKLLRVCPVKSVAPIKKDLVILAMKDVNKIHLTAPVKMGQVVCDNLVGSGVALVTTRDIKE